MFKTILRKGFYGFLYFYNINFKFYSFVQHLYVVQYFYY